MKQRIKLSQYAKRLGCSYQSALLKFHKGQIEGAFQEEDTGSIYVIDPDVEATKPKEERTCIYCRVSNQSRRKELDYQVQRCLDYCAANGFKVDGIYKEVASGMNDNRTQFWRMMYSRPTRIVVENKDRLTRFGYEYISKLYAEHGEIVVMNPNDNDEHDLMQDMISIVTSFCCRLYGMRRAKNKLDKIKKALEEEESKES